MELERRVFGVDTEVMVSHGRQSLLALTLRVRF